jgi:N-methylhydantoinase B/oxoprolinase/acetone carboxylase alpha subunit
MSFQCRYGCGTWCHVDPDIKTASGKLIPIQENGIPHDCHLRPQYTHKTTTAKAVSKLATKRIDDYQLIQETKEYVERVNVRLSQYKLNIVVNKKEQSLLEEML